MEGNREQLSDMQRRNIEAAMKLAQLSVENSQRIVALQLDVAKKLLQDSMDSAKALAAATDPQEAVALRTRFTQESAQVMIAAARDFAEIGNDARGDFFRLMAEQWTSSSKDMMEAFQSFFGAAPGQNASVMDTMQRAVAGANSAFEQLVRASTSVFGMGAQAAAGMADTMAQKAAGGQRQAGGQGEKAGATMSDAGAAAPAQAAKRSGRK